MVSVCNVLDRVPREEELCKRIDNQKTKTGVQANIVNQGRKRGGPVLKTSRIGIDGCMTFITYAGVPMLTFKEGEPW